MDADDGFVGLNEQLCFAVYAAAHAFNAAYRPLLEPHGLTYPQFLVLLVLWEKDQRSMKELGGLLQLDSGTLTPLTKRLESAGFLRRQRARHDERQLLVELTEKGQALRPFVGEICKAMICALGGRDEPVLKLREQIVKVTEQLRSAPHLQAVE
ncbi:MarR family transcriptional regulator [uncultured Methylobacterium sp.]|uniref:MarR family winged helix-turn-helix transcriptional regulator n=1 Tax=uncultured Methylobacterium sp. TaxID=157278 RepID=UPI002593F3C8|nr:MarR family transcriptional regulator [uncultured Methylobacterium sp.]